MPDAIYDVAIIGGGPAGSTAATLLARAGRRVIVCEREKFPRFHIGESLLPMSMKTFARLGVLEKFEQAGFLPKFGGEIASACADEGVKFYFEDGFRSQTESSYQVTRAQNSTRCCSITPRKTARKCARKPRSKGIEFFADRVELQIESKARRAGKNQRALCDRRERAALRSRQSFQAEGNLSASPENVRLRALRRRGDRRRPRRHADPLIARVATAGSGTFLCRGSDRASAWCSTPRSSSKAKKSPEEFLEEALAEQPFLARRMAHARRVTPAYASADFSYRQSRLTGDRWMLAGDAAGFIDPVFSSGVFLALLAGEQCADILDVVLDHPRKAPRLFARYERLLRRAMRIYLRIIDAWYSKEFIEVFLHPQDVFQIPAAVNAVLGGNISGSFALRWRMSVFYFIVWLQRYLPLCPRRTLQAKKRAEALVEPLAPRRRIPHHASAASFDSILLDHASIRSGGQDAGIPAHFPFSSPPFLA